jgi:hypothetical protein
MAGFWFRATLLDVELEQAAGMELPTDLGVVVAAIKRHGADLFEQPRCFDRVECWFEHFDVVTVRAVDSPSDRDAVGVDRERPFPTEFGPVYWAFAGSFTAVGCFVDAAIDGDMVEVEFQDSVIAGAGFGLEAV